MSVDYLHLAIRKSDGKYLQDEMVGSPHYKEKEVSLFQSNEIAKEFMKDGSVQVPARKRKADVSIMFHGWKYEDDPLE